MAWILRLEDQRMLRDPAPVAPPPAPPARRRAVVPPAPPSPDLVPLLADDEARVRRRAALAVGRVGLSAGVEPLMAVLGDADPEVRQMAAFALGLLGDARAREPLTRALADPSPLVQGSAAEALGLIGDVAAAEPIGTMIAQIVESGALAEPPADEADAGRARPASAFRLGVSALVRLKAFAPLAAAVLDGAGQPRVRWWPVAYALGRLEDARALKALLTLAQDSHPYTRSFAIRGLGALKDRAAIPLLVPLVSGADRPAAIEAIRALGRLADPAVAPVMLRVIEDPRADPSVRTEAVRAIGSMRADGVVDVLLDVLSEPSPEIRAAALGSLAILDPDGFVTVLSGLDPDPHWSVRAALASALTMVTSDIALPRLALMLDDADQRVVPAVLGALVRLRAPQAGTLLLERLSADDPAVRAAAAHGLGELKPAGGAAALAAAYERGLRDVTYIARSAALDALVKYGLPEADAVLHQALGDKDWAVRVRAAALLKQVDPAQDVATQIRPAPTRLAVETYRAPHLVNPPVSTHAYLETDKGTIQIELAVLDAPLTVDNFVTLARRGFFDGLSVHRVVPNFVIQTGDPRGDGEGGPSYTIRDELNELPFLRGTVGMALDWADTGGSQFFVTHAPQPHLDARYTAFGRVVAGMEVVDAMQQWNVIRRVRVWDGQ